MRPILRVIDEQTCEVNALFIQPTTWCANNCKGCYVKSYCTAETQVPWHEHKKLFDMFYHNQDGCWANQITISIDNLGNQPSEQQEHMVHWFSYPISSLILDKREPGERPVVHMTLHTIDHFYKYVNRWGGKTAQSCMTALDMLSLSRIAVGQLDELSTFIAEGANINYNHMIPADITTKNVDTYVDKIRRIGEVVNSIYIIIFKESMGKKLPMGNKADAAKWKLRRMSRLSHELAVINTLRSRLPKHVWQKVRVDGCLQDSAKNLRTGESCSSNVSRFQVWPDGSVTGCPYALHSDGPYGRTAHNILENIRRARGKNEFERRCYIPKVLDSLPRRSTSS